MINFASKECTIGQVAGRVTSNKQQSHDSNIILVEVVYKEHVCVVHVYLQTTVCHQLLLLVVVELAKNSSTRSRAEYRSGQLMRSTTDMSRTKKELKEGTIERKIH